MKNFFSPRASDYMTPLPTDSASPFPQEYDESNEREMRFLRNSSLHTRGNPEYEDVMTRTRLSFGPILSLLFTPLTWVFDHRPLCWIRAFVRDLIVSRRVHVVLRKIASNGQVLQNPHVQKEIDRLVAESEKEENKDKHMETREELMLRAHRIITRMAARQTDWVLRIFYILLSGIFRKLFHTVHVDKHGLREFHKYLETQEEGVGVVFLPTHKSHIDYLILSYVAALYDLPIPVIAAGDNLNIPLIGALFQYSGAFFMRRSLGDDTLYRAILEAYLEEVLRSGSTLEFFIEGGRSRDGTILPPKYGLLNVILEAVKTNLLKDAVLVPIAVDYEHCPDIGSYVKYLMGGKKNKESLLGLLRNASTILSMDCGDAFVTLGTPMSLKQLLERMEHEDATLNTRNEVKYVGAHVCQAMRVNSVVVSSTLVAAALMDYPLGEWVSEAEVTLHIETLRRWLHRMGAFEGYSGYSVSLLHQFVHSYPELMEVRDKQYCVRTGIKEQLTMVYQRNGLLHHFLADAVVLHVFKSMQIASGREALSLLDVVPAVELMCRIVGAHIPFNVVVSAPAIDALVARNVLHLEEDMLTLVPQQEEYTHFCVSLVAPIIDSLSVVTEAIKYLRPGTNEAEVDLTVFLLKCMEMSKAELSAGHSPFPLIANTQMLRNNVDGLVAAGVLSKRRENGSYFIRLSEAYENEEMLANLHQSIEGLRLNLRSVPVVKHDSDLNITDEMIDLMVDVGAKKRKGKK